MLYKGLKFGLLLQLAIGPVCLFIFQTAAIKGFFTAESGVAGVTIADGLFILTAILGLASIIEKNNRKNFLRILGAAILFIFGLSTLLSQFQLTFLPALSLLSTPSADHAFFSAVLLTFSNPLTILFWAGVFSAKITEKYQAKKEIYLFGTGSLFATIIFLTLTAGLGELAKAFIPLEIIRFLNIAVGSFLIYSSFQMILKRRQSGNKMGC